MTPPTDEPVIVDEDQKQHLTKLSDSVGLAASQKTAVMDIQPAFEQEPLDEQTKRQAEEYIEEKPEQDPKSTRTTKALNFLGKKMEWLRKKSGGNVELKS